MTLRRLRGEPAHEAEYARVFDKTRCATCALGSVRDRTYCPAQRPEQFGGLMIVGEGPGDNEARLKVPFVGASGRLLDALLARVGIAREQVWVTNASYCKPSVELAAPSDRAGSRKSWKDKQVQSAIEHCHDRLRAEVELVRPRVILCLGTFALQAVTGRWVERTRKSPLFVDPYGQALPCPVCLGAKTLPWWACTACGAGNFLGPGNDALCGWTEFEARQVRDEPACAACGSARFMQHADGCPAVPPAYHASCAACAAPARVAKIEPRKKRCPHCAGRKTRSEAYAALEADYGVQSAAGLVFRGPDAPDYERMAPEARVALPCRYVIATYHPAFLDREADTKSDKKVGGQFLVNAALAHLRKAQRLLSEDTRWEFAYHVVSADVVTPPSVACAWCGLMHAGGPESCAGAASDPGATLQSADTWQAWVDFLWRVGGAARFVTLDIETDNKDPWSVTDVRCIGFHIEGHPSVVFETHMLPREHPMIVALARFLESDSVTKCAQHGIYDLQVLWHVYKIELGGFSLDTMAAHHAVYPDEPHDLGHIAGIYTDSPPWKPAKKKGGVEVWESSAELHAYNARDCFNTTLAMERQLGELDAERARFVHDLDVAMFHVARDMERAGLPIDRERWQRWQARASFYADRDLALMRYFVGRPDFNPSSALQLQWALYDKAGPCRLVPAAYTDAGAPSANKAALLEHRAHPFVQLLLNFRRWRGLLSNILESAQLRADWRVRTRWNPLGTRTGRWSTGGEESGRKGNFQNWGERIDLLIALVQPDAEPYPLALFDGDRALVEATHGKPLEVLIAEGRHRVEVKGIRDVVVAPPGRRIVGADADQLELRIMAALSGDPTLIAKCKYADGKRKLEPEHDPHSYVASIAFGEAFTSPSLDTEVGRRTRDRLRFIIKRVIYGMFYGAGAETILRSIYDGGYEGPPITEEMIDNVIKAIFRAFPEVRVWRERKLREAEKTGRVWDALIGRRREFPLFKVDPTIVYNFPIQSSAGSLMNMSLWELRHALPRVDPSAMILAQVHDAIYIECAEERAADVAALLERCMSQELVLVEGAEPMPFPCKAKIGQSWIDL